MTIYGDVVSHVNISSVKSEDGGDYECTAQTKSSITGEVLYEIKHASRLNIYGMPFVREMPNKIEAIAGREFKLKCPVAGYPIDSVVWEKGKIKLKQ